MKAPERQAETRKLEKAKNTKEDIDAPFVFPLFVIFGYSCFPSTTATSSPVNPYKRYTIKLISRQVTASVVHADLTHRLCQIFHGVC